MAALITGVLVLHSATGWRGTLRLIPVAIVLGAVMGVTQAAVATKGPWNTAAFLGAMAGLAASFGLARFYRGERNGNGTLDVKGLVMALSGYVILVVVAMLVQVVKPIRAWLGGVVIQVQVPELSTSLGYVTQAGATKPISLLNHAGAVLFYTAVLVYILYRLAGRYRQGSVGRITSGTLKRVRAPSLSILLMVCMAIVMETSGMTETLARGLAEIAGRLFPLIAPWIGALGAFMTGSNTNSNVVFALLQLRTAELLGYPAAIILAGQTAGAGLASVVAPAKIVVGTSTADLAGREGEVMRTMLPYIVVLVVLISLLTAGAIWLSM
jgi:lactate permease